MIGEVIASGEGLIALLTNKLPCTRMLLNVSLVVGFHGELNAALVADVGLEPLVGAHVLLQQALAQIRLVALVTLEGSESLVFVLPHVVVQVILGDKHLLADLARVVLLALVHNPNMFVDGGFVQYNVTDGTVGRVRALLLLGQEVGLVL